MARAKQTGRSEARRRYRQASTVEPEGEIETSETTAEAVVVVTAGWDPIDPIVAALIAVWILPRAWALGSRAIRVLLQVAPEHVDLDKIRDELLAMEGVVDVHDLHVWTLTSEMEVASAHVMITPDTDAHAVLDQARSLLVAHDIAHATIQVEPDDHEGCEELNW